MPSPADTSQLKLIFSALFSAVPDVAVCSICFLPSSSFDVQCTHKNVYLRYPCILNYIDLLLNDEVFMALWVTNFRENTGTNI